MTSVLIFVSIAALGLLATLLLAVKVARLRRRLKSLEEARRVDEHGSERAPTVDRHDQTRGRSPP